VTSVLVTCWDTNFVTLSS